MQTRTTEHVSAAETAARARQLLPGGSIGDLTLPGGETFVAASGNGARLRDVLDREFLDLVCGSGAIVLGHAHPSVASAVSEQAKRGTHFYGLTDRALEMAEALVDAVPCAEQVRFTSTGSEATFYALRLARAFTSRDVVLKFEGSYIGHHDYGMFGVKPASSSAPHALRPDSDGVPDAIKQCVLLASYNDIQGTRALIQANQERLAAVIVEPVQRSIPPVPGFLESLRTVTRECGVLLIFDEVVTGFRLAYGGGQERFGVVPDLAAYGKAIANGFPLGAVAGRRDIMELADPGRSGTPEYVYVSGTLAGNPLSCAAGLATLHELRRPGAYETLNQLGEQFRCGLRDLLTEAGIQGCVLGVGAMFQVFFGVDKITDYRTQIAADRQRFVRFWTAMFKQRIFMSSRAKNYLSLAHRPAHVDEFLDAARAALREGV
jgi:glutamate-1-semialdehyde 2,1-aminomutase